MKQKKPHNNRRKHKRTFKLDNTHLSSKTIEEMTKAIAYPKPPNMYLRRNCKNKKGSDKWRKIFATDMAKG